MFLLSLLLLAMPLPQGGPGGGPSPSLAKELTDFARRRPPAEAWGRWLESLEEEHGAILVRALQRTLAELDPSLLGPVVETAARTPGPEGEKLLQELARRPGSPPEVRTEACRRLLARGPAGLAWVRGRLNRERDPAVRAALLEMFLALDEEGLEGALLRSLRSRDPTLRAAGLQGLDRLDPVQVRPLLRQIASDPADPARLEAARALAREGGSANLDFLLKLAPLVPEAEREAWTGILDEALRGPEEVEALLERGLGSSRAEVRRLALAVALGLDPAAWPALVDPVLGFLLDPEAEVRAGVLAWLEEKRPPQAGAALEDLLSGLESRPAAVASDLLRAAVLADPPPPGLGARVRRLAGRRGPLQEEALTALGRFPEPEARRLLLLVLEKEEDLILRAAALEGLLESRSPETVAALVELLGREEDPGLRRQLTEVLARLTGEDLGPGSWAWTRWWEDHRMGWQPPPREEALARLQEGRRQRTSGDTGARYHGLTIPGTGALVFILDTSGSMAAPAPSGQTWLREFAAALKQTLFELDWDRHVDLVVFSSTARAWQPRPVPLGPRRLAEAFRFLDSLEPHGGTNLLGGLEMALAMPETGHVFLLTDGMPSAGRLISWSEILLEVENLQAQRERPASISTIAAGMASYEALSELAHRNGGEAVDLRDL